VPDFIASRKKIPDDPDFLMSFAQIGIFCGMTVAICVRIRSNKDTILSLFDAGRRRAAHESVKFGRHLIQQNECRERGFSFIETFIKFICAALPFVFAAMIHKNAVRVISLISSLYCPYFIVIIPGKLIRSDEFERSFAI